jgi:CRISPR-associated DxTHG motif protein
MRTIITFLNDKGLKPGASYLWQGKEYKGGVFALALRQFVEHDQMLLCNTPEAQEKTFPDLEKLNDPRIKPLLIPKGENESEMWEIFTAIAAKINTGETVIFDITHGLRSVPFLVFLFAAYLKFAKAVTIEAIYYGAYELGSPAPVIDLSKFIEMIDWLTATDRFVATGDGQALADLLTERIPSTTELRDDPTTRSLKSQLKKAADAIQAVSLALNVARPIETMESTVQLEEILDKAASSFDQRAKPFSLLSERVVQEYGQFALANSTDKAALAQNLRLQLQMIQWYVKRDKLVQAVTLAREWLVSVIVLQFDESMFDNRNGRNWVENAFNNAVENRKPNPRPVKPSRCDAQFESLAEADGLASLWEQMRELRNDIAHVGMNRAPKSAGNLKKTAKKLCQKLNDIGRALLLTGE